MEGESGGLGHFITGGTRTPRETWAVEWQSLILHVELVEEISNLLG